MITNLNYILNNGGSLVYYYNDSLSQTIQSFDNQVLYRDFLLDYYELYYKQLATINGNPNVYILNLENIKSVDYTEDNLYFSVNFKNNSLLLIEFVNVSQCSDNYEYLMSCLKAYNIQEYLLTKNKLYVCSGGVEDLDNNIYTDIQTAIDNWTNSDIVYVQSGTYNLTSVININESVEIYFEDNAILNITGYIDIFRYESTLSNQYINIYGNAVINGGVYLYDINSQTTVLNGLNFFLECFSIAGVIYKNSCGKTRVRAYSKLYQIGNSIDTDALNDVLDIDILHIEKPQSYLLHPLTADLSRIYFRNCNMAGNMNMDTGASGTYNINYIQCNFDLSIITFSDSNNSTVNIWNSYFVTNQDYLLQVTSESDININFYGKNYSNKNYPDYAFVSGSGSFEVDTDLNL
jgi:hypothetical protein